MAKTLKFRLESASPLIMHNGQLADPFNAFTKALKKVSGKRKKTDEDFIQMAEIEFRGGLYLEKGKPCIPAEAVEATLLHAAMTKKMGKQAKIGLYCTKNIAIEYEGPKTPDALWADENFRFVKGVRIGQSKVMRTRPIFNEWAGDLEITFNPGVFDEDDIREIVKIAGESIGFLEWRPKFGRFTIAK